MTANGLAGQALRDLGVIRNGFTASADMLAEMLVLLNQMLDEWNAEGLSVFSETRATYSLTAGDSEYTLGASGADFTATRPAWVMRAGRIATSGANEDPVRLLTLAEWQRKSDGLYVVMDYPLITLKLYPEPSTGETLVLYTPEPLGSFADGTTVYTFPPAYEIALRRNLAAAAAPMMSPHFKQVQPLLDRVDRAAMASKRAIQRLNFKPGIATIDNALISSGRFDIELGRVG